MSEKILKFWRDDVSGETPFDDLKMVCVSKPKYDEVELCVKAGMNIPFARIKLYDSNLAKDAAASFETAVEFGEAIAEAWNKRNSLAMFGNVHAAVVNDLISIGEAAKKVIESKGQDTKALAALNDAVEWAESHGAEFDNDESEE